MAATELYDTTLRDGSQAEGISFSAVDKVRIVDETRGTEAAVRVLIDSTDGERHWSTVGCSTNIIDASWLALVDGLEYWLLKYGGC